MPCKLPKTAREYCDDYERRYGVCQQAMSVTVVVNAPTYELARQLVLENMKEPMPVGRVKVSR